MDMPWPPAQEPRARALWESMLTPLARQLEAEAADFALVLTETMRERVPEVVWNDVSFAQQLVSAEASIKDIGRLLASASDPVRAQLPEPTIQVGQDAAHRQIGVTPLVRSYRLGHELLLVWFLDRLAAAGSAADALEAAALFGRWSYAYIDTVSGKAEELYESEREAWMRSSLFARVEAVTDILAGTERDAARAGTRLGYDLGREHVALEAWSESTEADAGVELGRVVNSLARAVGCAHPLVIPEGPSALTAWLSRSRGFENLDKVREVALPATVRLAMGAPGAGLDGFRRTRIEAGEARRVARLISAPTGSITRYDDVALVALASQDTERAGSFVRRVLGRLAAPDETSARAAESLAAYLAHNRSRKHAAAVLHVHANTVIYRVRQAEELLGRSVEVDELELRVALALLPAVRT